MSTFYIPKPCHENWNTMTPEEKGRHCAVCATVVVDFTKKTPIEVAEIVSTAEGTVCGHFSVNQLDAKAQTKVFRNPLNLFNKNWKYFAMSVFGLFFMNKKSIAQEIEGKIKMRGMVAPTHNANSQASTITGIITSNEGMRLIGANVIISSNGIELANVLTDTDGKYLVKIEAGKIVNKKISVSVHHMEYNSKNILDLGIYKHVTTLNIQMEWEVMLMGIVEEIREPEVILTDTGTSILPVNQDSIEVKTNIGDEKSDLIQDTNAINLIETQTQEKGPINKETETPEKDFVILPQDIVATIYPNPAGTYATVYCKTNDTYTIDLVSLSGALLQTQSFNGDRLRLDVSKLERGTYFVRVNNETGTLNTLKLIKN
jgi:hypothetical protein